MKLTNIVADMVDMENLTYVPRYEGRILLKEEPEHVTVLKSIALVIIIIILFILMMQITGYFAQPILWPEKKIYTSKKKY